MVAASLVHNSRVFHIPVNLTANTGIVLILIRHMHYHKSLVFLNYISRHSVNYKIDFN